jgi:DNA-binding response OmpR family regulator
MASDKILIVEDDPTIQRVLKDNFEFSGYRVRIAGDGRVGWQAVQEFKPDLIILDVMLPHVNGFDLCRRIRKASLTMPVIMLTAKGQESDIVLGLNLGADDYLTKPFSIDVLLARVGAVLRRQCHLASEPESIEFGESRIDLAAHKLLRNGREVPLTPKEFALLKHFVTHPGRALSRDQLLDAVWGADLIVTQRSVDRCINTLRKKIEAQPDLPRFIVTLRDVGYRFELPEA